MYILIYFKHSCLCYNTLMSDEKWLGQAYKSSITLKNLRVILKKLLQLRLLYVCNYMVNIKIKISSFY